MDLKLSKSTALWNLNVCSIRDFHYENGLESLNIGNTNYFCILQMLNKCRIIAKNRPFGKIHEKVKV